MTPMHRQLLRFLCNSQSARKCGAKTRAGRPCKLPPAKLLGRRCYLHGGLSTGPRTEQGRARIAAAQRERWRQWRAAKGFTDKSSEKVARTDNCPVSGP